MGKQASEKDLLASLAQLTILIKSLDEKDGKGKYDTDTLRASRNLITSKLHDIAWEQYKEKIGIKEEDI